MAENTVKYNQLTPKAELILTDLLGVASADGVLYSSTLEKLQFFLSTLDGVSFKGTISAGTYATKDAGWYFASNTGNYVMGSTTIAVDVSDTLTIIIVPSFINDSSKVEIPINITIDAVPTDGSTNAVESGGVFNELNKLGIFTKDLELNQVIKEIYLTNTSNLTNFKINFYKNFNGTYQLRIYADVGEISTYVANTASSGTVPNSYLTITDKGSFGVSGYVVIDWDYVISENLYASISLLPKIFNIDFSPTIKAYQTNITLQNNIEAETTARELAITAVENDVDTRATEVNLVLRTETFTTDLLTNKFLKEIFLEGEGVANYDFFSVGIYDGFGGTYRIRIYGVKTVAEVTTETYIAKADKTNTGFANIIDNGSYGVTGYVVWDWTVLDGVLDVYPRTPISNRCLNVEYSPSIKTFLSNKEIEKLQYEVGTKEPTYLHAYSDNSLATENTANGIFVGLTSIHRAINSITDASANKRYVVKVYGNFIATVPAHFSDAGNGEFAVFSLTPSQQYISVQGQGEDKTIVSGFLLDNLGTDFDYDMYSTVVQNGNHSTISDMTLDGKNGRYVIHTDKSGTGEAVNYVQYWKNVYIKSRGNTGDALTVWGSFTPFGMGMGSGHKIFVENCTFDTHSDGAFYIHSNENFADPFHYKLDNCKAIMRSTTKFKLAHVASISANVKGIFELNSCSGMGYFGFGTSIKSNLPTDLHDIRVVGHNNTDYGYTTDNDGATKYQLRISVTDTNAEHSVKFDENSTAYDIICKGEVIEKTDAIGNVFTLGQMYKDGGIGFKAWCMGLLPVPESIANANMGERLGDCSITPKTLTITIDSTDYNVVFNTDLSNSTNDDVLAIINSVLSGVATADLYSLSYEYYMELDTVQVMQNNDATSVLSGMIVTKKTNGFRKALLSDINAEQWVCLDNCKSGDSARVLKRGFITPYNRYTVLKTGAITEGVRYSANDNSVLAANTNGKFLAVSNAYYAF